MAPTPRLAPSLVQFRGEINARYPNRDKTSDGWIGDAAHAARQSDHNPDAFGIVRAFDCDEDLTGGNVDTGAEARATVEHIRNHKDARVKYVIYEGRLFSSYTTASRRAWEWGPYSGPNAHRRHLHISILATRSAAESVYPWLTGSLTPIPPTPQPGGTCTVQLRVLKQGMSGGDVTSLQTLLNVKAGAGLMLDGKFGPATDTKVRALQKFFGLPIDGEVGAKTWPALFL